MASSIPANLTRVPTLLGRQVSLRSLVNTNVKLLQLQEQMSTAKRINRPSDDPIAASMVGVLDQRLELSGQRSRNLQHAQSTLGTLDAAMAEINNLLLESKTIASSQIGIGSDAETRRQESAVVDSLLDGIAATMNRSFVGIHVFGGAQVGEAPIERFHGGYRYIGAGDGLVTDLGDSIDFPITIGADRAVGALSSRIEGDVDLDPQVTGATRVADLRGPAAGTELGPLVITIDDGGGTVTTATVDLSAAATMGDVMDLIESGIREADAGAFGATAWPGGVTIAGSGDRLSINAAGAYSITFDNGPTGNTARALGLDGFTYAAGTEVDPAPEKDLDPQIGRLTTFAELSPGTPIDFGDITIRNGTRVGTVTLAPGMTIDDFDEAVRRLDLGVRVEIGEDGNTLDLINEVSGFRMAVEESGSLTATTLGVRTLMERTRLEDFNDGRGVEIAHGETDPISGLPDADRNTDFEVFLSDGSSFVVDLTPADAETVQGVIDKIRADAAASGLAVPADFDVQMAATGNGLVLQDTLGGGNVMRVVSLNGFAAEDLGLLDGTGAVGSLTSSDHAQVRVDSVLSTLIELRDALTGNDGRGITFAGSRFEEDLDRLSSARGLVGSRARRLENEQRRVEDDEILNTSLKSELQDLDFFEASSRFSLLQTQLQAGLTVTAQLTQLSLLNFLG